MDTSQVINIRREDCWMHRLWLKQPKLHLSYINNSDRGDNVLWFVFWWGQMKFLFKNCRWVFPQVYVNCGSGVRDLLFALVAFELICASLVIAFLLICNPPCPCALRALLSWAKVNDCSSKLLSVWQFQLVATSRGGYCTWCCHGYLSCHLSFCDLSFVFPKL